MNGPIQSDRSRIFALMIVLCMGTLISMSTCAACDDCCVHCCAVSGNYAYVGVLGHQCPTSLIVLDIANPRKPLEVGRMEINFSKIALSGNYAYLTYTGKLTVVDITDPTSPTSIGNYDISGCPMDIVVSGNYAYVVTYTNGLEIIDISKPASPIRAGKYSEGPDPEGVAVSGDYAYIANRGDGLVIIDISNPSMPMRIGSYDTEGIAWDVAISGNHAYVADWDNGIVIVDVTNPTTPKRVGHYDVDYAWSVAVSGNYMYYANMPDDGFEIVDITDPTSPTPVGNCRVFGDGVAVSGNYAYVIGGWYSMDAMGNFYDYGSLVIVDITNHRFPSFIGGYNPSTSSVDTIATTHHSSIESVSETTDTSDRDKDEEMGIADSKLEDSGEKKSSGFGILISMFVVLIAYCLKSRS